MDAFVERTANEHHGSAGWSGHSGEMTHQALRQDVRPSRWAAAGQMM